MLRAELREEEEEFNFYCIIKTRIVYIDKAGTLVL